MKVYAIGASRNIGYLTALRLLAKGATVTFLMRSPSAFDANEEMQNYIKNGTARLVKGDALNREDVLKGWEVAAEPESPGGARGVDVLLFSVGSTSPKLHPLKGVIILPADLVTHTLVNTLSTIPTDIPTPRIVAVTSVGLTKESHAALPLPTRALYSYLLDGPHEDKKGAETVLAHVMGTEIDASLPPTDKRVLPDGWKDTPGLPPAGSLASNTAIVRPIWLTDGKCRSDEKGNDAYRVRAEGYLPVKRGYTISRKDVAHFIAERLLEDEWETWKGKGIALAY